MPRLTKDEISQYVYQQIADSEGYDNDELAAIRKDALDYYYNRESAAPSLPGRSALQSSDVADMIEAVVAQVMPAFDMESPVEFQALSEEDEDQARTETNAVNYVVMEQNNGFYEIQQAIRDALLLRNGVMKVYLDEKTDVETVRYEMLTELEYGNLVQRDSGDLSKLDNGMNVKLISEEPKGFYNVEVKTKTTLRKICSKAVDPTYFSWEREHDSIYLQDVRFCAERSLPTRSDLIQMGYPKRLINSLNSGGSVDTSTDTMARNQNATTKQWRGTTPASDIIETYECYIRLDADGDGIAELLKVVVANDQVLEAVEVDFIPYASGTPFLQPHRFNGLGMFDKLRYIQDQKTFGIRQWADNTNNANNARVGVVDGAVNTDDITNSRPGGIVRMSSPDAVVPFPFTDVGGSIGTFLEYTDKMRSERGGASLDMQAAELQVAGHTAHGVERQMSAKELMASMITRTIAETLLRTVYELVHKAMRLYVPDELTFRAGGEFVTVNPSEWQERKYIDVKAGLSLAERTRKTQALQGIMAHQGMLLQLGMDGTMVDEQSIYAASMEWCRASGISNPEQYLVDPNSEQSQQAAQQKQQQAQQEAQAAQAQQQEMLQLQKMIELRKADNEDARVMEDGRQHDEELQFKYWEAGQQQALEEAKLTVQVAGDMLEPETTSSGDTGVRAVN